jgi:ATP-dependent DNA helicase RecQ
VCEHYGIPVRWALDQRWLPRLHRIREVAYFLDLLDERRNDLMTASELLALHGTTTCGAQDNVWSRTVTRLLEDWRLDTADASLPCNHAREYLYESLADQGREQTIGDGVFLSTVHAAKGTEFDHVLLPRTGWTWPSTRALQEEERRLLYVGMTRARKTLTLLDAASSRNPYIPRDHGEHYVRRTAPDGKRIPPAVLDRAYEMLGLSDVYVDFAARRPATDPLHAAIARLQPGDCLNHRLRNGIVELLDTAGQAVARLSQAASVRWQDRLAAIERIRVVAVVRRDRTEAKPEYRDACRCDRWEVPLVEIVHSSAE